MSVPVRARLNADYDRFRAELPADLRAHCLDAYGIDIAGEYAGEPIRNPFGKASGQLSLNARQVRRDAEAGLGFVVLKTVIAEDEAGRRAMGEWAVPEARMRVERITAPDGTPGWTVTWKGRGWHRSFGSYLEFFGEALDAAGGMPVAPSVKYHLPGPDEAGFAVGEYRHTTRRLQEVWKARRSGPMPLEKDFSPTLAGDDRSRERDRILTWLREVPDLIRSGAEPPGVRLGVKLMNARFGTAFQVEMLRTIIDGPAAPPGYLVYANRLFDPHKEFEGTVGVAYGGPELRRRNLEALAALRRARPDRPPPSISGTGDILTGAAAVEYGLRGAASCQMHTLFQLPDTEFGAVTRNKTAAVLHHLVLHPEHGLIRTLADLGDRAGRTVHWRDLPDLGREIAG